MGPRTPNLTREQQLTEAGGEAEGTGGRATSPLWTCTACPTLGEVLYPVISLISRIKDEGSRLWPVQGVTSPSPRLVSGKLWVAMRLPPLDQPTAVISKKSLGHSKDGHSLPPVALSVLKAFGGKTGSGTKFHPRTALERSPVASPGSTQGSDWQESWFPENGLQRGIRLLAWPPLAPVC